MLAKCLKCKNAFNVFLPRSSGSCQLEDAEWKGMVGIGRENIG